MIERYTNKEMKLIWSEEKRFETWLQVELAVIKAYVNKGIIPIEDFEKIKNNARINLKRIKELEEITRHDVIAFTRQISETLGNEAKWVHYSLTSTDVVDTANGIIIKEANLLIEKALLDFIDVLKKKALKYQNTPCIGRTHGIHGEITSFGLKWVLWYDEAIRNLDRFKIARSEIEVGKISGAVGNFANLDPDIEEEVCKSLGINYALISTQVLSRDLHINYLSSISLIASMLEKIATEIRHLSRTEVSEVEEYFESNQKGSSAMPHKRNPIASENICGLARMIRSYLSASFENNPLWHERDISHSSVERIILPDATTLIYYMLTRYTKVLDKLVVNEKVMLGNIHQTKNIIFSGRVVSLLINKGLTREISYDMVQALAQDSYREKSDFKDLVLKSKILKYANLEELEKCFEINYYLRNVDAIYKRNNIGGK